MMLNSKSDICYCGSGKKFEQCCAPEITNANSANSENNDNNVNNDNKDTVIINSECQDVECQDLEYQDLGYMELKKLEEQVIY